MIRFKHLVLGGGLMLAGGVAAADMLAISPLIGEHLFDKSTTPDLSMPDREMTRARQYTLDIAYRFTPNWSLEGSVGRSVAQERDPFTSITSRYRHADLNVSYRFNTDGVVQPFLLAGAGRATYNTEGADPFKREYGQVGGGIVWAISSHIGLRTEIRFMDMPSPRWGDWVGLVGLEFGFGGFDHAKADMPTTPAPEETPAMEPPAAAAPAQESVPVADDDHDGVPNDMDKCPNTPEGVKVDANGCPLDADLDGVPDYMDKCPDTPAGVKVDSVGCPLDSDHDGVPDYLDKCPNTRAGAAVDSNGCYVMLQNKESINLDVSFATGKALILGDASAELHKVADFMKKYPTLTVVIEGHTDNLGNPAANKLLSAKRAEAVKQALVALGVDAARLKAVGYGALHPVADNATEEGRAKNRRVVATANAESDAIKMRQ